MDETNTEVTHQNNIQPNIFTEQINILYKNLLVSVLASFICSSVVFIGLYHTPKNEILRIWFAFVILVSLFRLSASYFYHYHPKSNQFYLYIFICGMAVSATLWGIAGSVLMPQGELLKQMIVIVIIAGVTAGGVQTLHSNLAACLMYVVFTVLPLCIWLFLQPENAYIVLGLSMTTYLLFMLVTSLRANKLLLSELTLRYENLELINNLSISNKKLSESYKLLEQHEHEIELINEMNSLLQVCNESSEAYDTVRFTAEKLFFGFSGGLSILNTITNDFENIIQWGENQSLKPVFGIADCWALRKGREYLVNHASNEVTCHHFNSPPKSFICLPINSKNGNMGLLVLHAKQEGSFTDYQLQLATSFIEVIQLALMNIKLRESLHDEAIHDPLTKLFNRRYLDETLLRELRLVIRDKKSLCVAILDLDFFKLFNDQNGHEAGDIVLQFIGHVLKDNFRESDLACRFGGEEFLIVLVNSDLTSAYTRLERIRETIKKRKIYYQGKLLPSITLSIGVAEAPMQGSTEKDIIRAADEALYAAKKSGRDKTVVSTQEPQDMTTE